MKQEVLCRLRTLNIQPRTKDVAGTEKFPFVVFAAPPSGSTDYVAEVRRQQRSPVQTSTCKFCLLGVYLYRLVKEVRYLQFWKARAFHASSADLQSGTFHRSANGSHGNVYARDRAQHDARTSHKPCVSALRCSKPQCWHSSPDGCANRQHCVRAAGHDIL